MRYKIQICKFHVTYYQHPTYDRKWYVCRTAENFLMHRENGYAWENNRYTKEYYLRGSRCSDARAYYRALRYKKYSSTYKGCI